MIPVLTTAVILLLYCSLFQTNADGPVTSNDTSGDVSDKARARSIRQIPMCEDEFETLRNTSYASQAGFSNLAVGNFTLPRQCLDWCMQNVNCVSALHVKGVSQSACYYTATLVRTAPAVHVCTYFRIIFRCPKHYRCSDTPCQNGATCINATTSGRGVTCICTDGWKSWFCEKRQTCLDHKCQNGATCRYTKKVGITCSCPAGYEGFYCQWPPNTTATTINLSTTIITSIITTEDNSDGMSAKEKTLVVAGVTAGVVVTGVAAAAVIGAAASTTTAAAATTGGATVVASGGGNVAEIGGKAGASTVASVMRKWNKGVGKRRELDDEEENEASTSEISLIDSLYAQVKALMIAEDDKPTSGK